ncbi:YbaB/EbfC family nucleoid-associated protein [Actinoallomurus sp. NPDC052274]|uniref:YbaB/EbfC family nucleoid-associated protein n=1 Tax=Actinoallomurus sp. NPDC052274 TaxID=3155420 RepID=UPI003431654B
MASDNGFFGHTGNEEFDRILAQVGEQMQRFEEARKELSSLKGRATAADGQVEVEVLPSGALSSLQINPRAMRLGSEALAEAILEAAGKAAKEAAERMNEIMGSVTGRSADFSQLLQGKLLSMNPDAESDLHDPQLADAMEQFQEMRRRYGL